VDQCPDRTYQNSGNQPLLRLLPRSPGLALDCGCGAGDNARILSSWGWEVVGVTISPKERQLAERYCSQVLLADLSSGLPPELRRKQFDAVIMSHVIEHLVDPKPLLRDAAAALARGGVLAVAVPNALTYPVRFDFLRGRFEYTEAGILDSTHVRFYTFTSGKALLESCGWRLASASAYGAFPLWKLRRVLPPVLVRRINEWACKASPGLFGTQCLYIASPHS